MQLFGISVESERENMATSFETCSEDLDMLVKDWGLWHFLSCYIFCVCSVLSQHEHAPKSVPKFLCAYGLKWNSDNWFSFSLLKNISRGLNLARKWTFGYWCYYFRCVKMWVQLRTKTVTPVFFFFPHRGTEDLHHSILPSRLAEMPRRARTPWSGYWISMVSAGQVREGPYLGSLLQ